MIRQMCDRVGVMKMGTLLEVAPTEQLFNSPSHEYSKQLISLMPEFTGLRRCKNGLKPYWITHPSGWGLINRSKYNN